MSSVLECENAARILLAHSKAIVIVHQASSAERQHAKSRCEQFFTAMDNGFRLRDDMSYMPGQTRALYDLLDA